jgi:DNA-binding MarR family transcriptional regulator
MEGGTADRLHSVAIRVLRHARGADAGMGMSATRASALSVLVFGGARTVSELAAAEQVSVPTMTRLLQAMEAEGWVRRRRDVRDSRVVRVTATARGRRALRAGRAARVERIETVLARLSARDRRVVDRALDALAPLFSP